MLTGDTIGSSTQDLEQRFLKCLSDQMFICPQDMAATTCIMAPLPGSSGTGLRLFSPWKPQLTSLSLSSFLIENMFTCFIASAPSTQHVWHCRATWIRTAVTRQSYPANVLVRSPPQRCRCNFTQAEVTTAIKLTSSMYLLSTVFTSLLF